MDTLNVDSLVKLILEFTNDARSVLFTGAGVGKKVGLPLWPEYLELLAGVCEKWRDSLSAELIRQKIRKENYLGAAAVYEGCEEIPDGERWKGLSAPFKISFSNGDLGALKPLFGLPFGAVVTTNYDRSQHDATALARGRTAIPLELDDGTLRSGPLQTQYFLARLHGRAEFPETIVLYPSSYERIANDSVYEDFLMTLLSERPCLFVGFSFVDPAIRNVLGLYERKRGRANRILHCAILPDDSSPQLRQWLLNLNVQVELYNAAESHRDLWKAIVKAESRYRRGASAAQPVPRPKVTPTHYSAFQRFFAFTYAQIQTAKEVRPVLEQARDGLVLSLVREGQATGVTESELLAATRDALNLSEEEARDILRASVTRLLVQGELHKEGDYYFADDTGSDLLAQHIEALVRGISNRIKVCEGFQPSDALTVAIRKTLERVFVIRAWDLGAHYAGAGTGFSNDLSEVVHEVAVEVAPDEFPNRSAALERSCLNLLTTPSDSEAENLAEVARSAFALQLVLASPRQALLRKFVLPHKVYFDASVLLPALVPGHPYRAAYWESIKRLRQAARQSELHLELLVGQPFLNEIISHRDIGRRISEELRRIGEELGIDQREALGRTIAFYGSENNNVYISAFASHIGRIEEEGKAVPTFKEFLRNYASYETEEALAQHLKLNGFIVVPMDFRWQHNDRFTSAFNPLVMAYEEEKADMLAPKEKVLVEHEARQLVQLELDQEAGNRSIFVSADRRLCRALTMSMTLSRFAGAIVPPEGFIGLVDIVVGLEADKRALARLVWAAPRRSVDQAIRDYVIRQALPHMDAAQAKAMPLVIDDILADAKLKIKTNEIDILSGNEPDAVAKAARFMDRIEEDLFGKIDRAIKKEWQ